MKPTRHGGSIPTPKDAPPFKVTLAPDECVVSRDGVCVRGEHPDCRGRWFWPEQMQSYLDRLNS